MASVGVGDEVGVGGCVLQLLVPYMSYNTKGKKAQLLGEKGKSKSEPREGVLFVFVFPNSLPILDHFTDESTYMEHRHCLLDSACGQRALYALRGRPLRGIFVG